MWHNSRNKSVRFVGTKWTTCAMGLSCNNYGIGDKPSQYDGVATFNQDAESLMGFHVLTMKKGGLKRAG